MGENNLILDKPPKNLQYIRQLLNYNTEKTFWGKAASWLTQDYTTEAHSVSQWCRILGSKDSNPETRKFLQTLINENALIKKPGTENPELYKLDKERLYTAIYNDPYYHWHKNLFFRVINTQEKFKKVKTDF